MQINSIKWGLVTFCGCITCALIAHFLPVPAGLIATFFLSCVVSMIGAAVVSVEQNEM